MTTTDLCVRIAEMLQALRADYAGLDLRGRVLRVVEIVGTDKTLGAAVLRDSGLDAEGARERLRLYMVAHVGIVLDAMELEVVAGISEYARRIRELRKHDGYAIATGLSDDPEVGLHLGPSQYMLLRPEPDREAANRWHLANRIRQDESLGARGRILAFLKQNVGKAVTCEEIRYVANVADYGRRTRELRTEQGFAISTRMSGRADLAPGLYVLESLDRVAEPHDRSISEAVQRLVYARDGDRCRACGWSRDRWDPGDSRLLELHHVEHHADGGANTPDNLVVLCSRCHDEVHAGTRDGTLLLETPASGARTP